MNFIVDLPMAVYLAVLSVERPAVTWTSRSR